MKVLETASSCVTVVTVAIFALLLEWSLSIWIIATSNSA